MSVVIIQRDETVVVIEPQKTVVEIVSPGPQGIPGPQGPAGTAGGEIFEFTQASPVTPWVVVHNLNTYPDVTIVVDGEEVDADVIYNSLNSVTISFASPQAGEARLRP